MMKWLRLLFYFLLIVYSIIFSISLARLLLYNDVFNLFKFSSKEILNKRIIDDPMSDIYKIRYSILVESKEYKGKLSLSKKKILKIYPNIKTDNLEIEYNEILPGINYLKGFKHSTDRFLGIIISSLLLMVSVIGKTWIDKRFKSA